MQVEETETYFLPAKRLGQDAIIRLSQEIAQSPSAASLALIPLAIVIVNETRQIVYANERFLALTDTPTIEAILGKRLGEALDCEHAHEMPGGCGTTRFCRYCGAALALVKSLEGEQATQECAINRNESTLESLNLQVWTAPMEVAQHQLVLNSILDIAHEKALRSFEHIFFHDILNAVSGIKGIHDLLALDLQATAPNELELLGYAIGNMQDIIETQREFMAVEAHEYQPTITPCNTRDTLVALTAYCQSFNPGNRQMLMLAAATVSMIIFSDTRLIQRILVNMVKNALEASAPGDTVTLGCDAGSQDTVTFWVHNPAVLSEKVRMRIFHKGFSTKGTGRGFGTYSMRLFARQGLGGMVAFESTQENGTRFFLQVPVRQTV